MAFHVRKGFSEVTSPLLHDSIMLPQGTSRNWTQIVLGMAWGHSCLQSSREGHRDG